MGTQNRLRIYTSEWLQKIQDWFQWNWGPGTPIEKETQRRLNMLTRERKRQLLYAELNHSRYGTVNGREVVKW